MTVSRIKRTPTILQAEAVECGAVSLAILLAHHKSWVSIEDLRELCAVSRDGAKAINILKAARELGLTARGVRCEPEALYGIPMPIIAHWRFDHFLVVEGFSKREAFLNDPAVGRRRISLREFEESFTGIALLVSPGPNYVPAGKQSGAFFDGIREFVVPFKRGMGMAFLLGVYSLVISLALPTFIRVFVDQMLLGRSLKLLPLYALLLMAASSLAALILYIQNNIFLRMELRINKGISTKLFWEMMSLPLRFFAHRRVGDINPRFESVDRIAKAIASDLSTAALCGMNILFMTGMLFSYNARLALIDFTVIALGPVAFLCTMRKRKDLSRMKSMEAGVLAGITVSMVKIIETIKSSGLENGAFTRWAGAHARLLNVTRRVGHLSSIVNSVPPITFALAECVTIALGIDYVAKGVVTVGTLIAFHAILLSIALPLFSLVEIAGKLQMIEADVSRLRDIFNYPASRKYLRSSGNDAADVEHRGRLEIDNVTYAYSNQENPVVNGLSLQALPGARIALVGPSGSGKTTVGKLICGLLEPSEGSIELDGCSVKDIQPQRLAAVLSYVDQEIFLFEGTLRDNVSLWNSEIVEDDIWRALADADIERDVRARPSGLDSFVEEGGFNFSGGQRQKLEIARALASNPRILILDEATSALDPLSERIIEKNIRRRRCTLIVIAHRLSTIASSDEILCLQGGRVVERGKHADLLARRGMYARLYDEER